MYEIHTSMDAGSLIPKGEIKPVKDKASEDHNIDIGFHFSLPGKAQVLKVWAIPDEVVKISSSSSVGCYPA
ncbi:hypothetical protein [Endozoicomonas atrinae]|uniref:hypothetical protein n=1 Tax=Endozoicomonas atrinae TaxID=1333660 RepID=UPI0008262031|nr:hypothetical protein [Endozoicomonas atrinae]